MVTNESSNSTRLGWKRLSYSINGVADKQQVELGFVIAVIANLSGHSEKSKQRLRDRCFVHLDADNIDDFMHSIRPSLELNVPDLLEKSDDSRTIGISLAFLNMSGFRPEEVAAQVPQMATLLSLRQQITPLAMKLEVRPEFAVELLSKADSVTSATADSEPVTLFLRSLDFFQREHLRATMLAKIEDIDARLALQLDCIYHQKEFQRLEATWRGIAYLVREVEASDFLKLRVLNASTSELATDFKRNIEISDSALFKRVYEDGACTFGDEPVSLIVCDIELDRTDASINLAKQLSHVAATSYAPMLLGASPVLFGLDEWSELRRPRDLTKIFDTIDYEKWRSFRADEDSKYLVVVVPSLLARVPWDTREAISEYGISYCESCTKQGQYLWMNGVYGMAALLANAFVRDGWCADLRGPIWGRIDGLYAHHVASEGSVLDVIGPVAVDLPDRRHDELNQLGFTSIARHVNGEFAAAPAPRVLGSDAPTGRDSRDATVHTESQLEQLLCKGRFLQAMRCFLKNNVGTWRNLEQAAEAMHLWLTEYRTLGNTEPKLNRSAAPLAPLVSTEVTVSKTGKFLDVKLEMNYVPSYDVVTNVFQVRLPVNLLSSRIIP